ncbi:MAG TPA: tetratricopeptide repeat protein [Nitrospinota bacterium]|nr:tetratricopeptide repeat protein [Nitrospinota bacterium]
MKRTAITLLTTLAVLLGSADVSWSADFNKGYDAYKKGDYKTALREFKPLAEQEHALAQTILGLMYRKGRGVVQDYKTAVKWYTLAAEQGDANAQAYLGVMYVIGKGVPEDYVYAYMWINIAASSGDKNAAKARGIVTKAMTPAEISAAQNLARECVRKKYKGC